jgi:hypothetical protein
MSIIAEKSQSQKKVNTAMMITFSQEKVIMKKSARTFSREDFSRNRDDAARKSHPEKKRNCFRLGEKDSWGRGVFTVGPWLRARGQGRVQGQRQGRGQGSGQGAGPASRARPRVTVQARA